MDLRELAQRRLPRPIFDFMDGAAETETTSQRNTAAFDDIKILPRSLIDVTNVKTATNVLGQHLEWPVLCSPTGASRLFHPHGEIAVARAAANARTLYCLSTSSTCTLEDVAASTPSPKAFQLYVADRDITMELIERCKRANYAALILTVDAAVVGKRERDLRSGFGIHPKWSVQSLASFARHPMWIAQRIGQRALSLAHPIERDPTRPQRHPFVSWQDVRDIRDAWGGHFALKGVMSADDARRAADAGVRTIIVSNHGGRQLDGAAAAIEALPEIVRAVGDRVDVILDGGVRRGVHVLKALALGAKACAIGRPYLYGLSAGGEAGVARTLEILRTELVLAMQLSGCADIRNIDPKLIKN